MLLCLKSPLFGQDAQDYFVLSNCLVLKLSGVLLILCPFHLEEHTYFKMPYCVSVEKRQFLFFLMQLDRLKE